MPLEVTLSTPASQAQPPHPIMSLTPMLSGLSFGTAIPGGFSSCSFSLSMPQPQAYEWYSHRGGYHVEVNEGGHVVWEGRIESIGLEPFGISVQCVGYWASLTDRIGFQWWSDSAFDSWREGSILYLTVDGVPVPAFSNPKFAIVKEAGIVVALRNPEVYQENEAAGFAYILPIPPVGVADSDFWMQPGTIKVVEIGVEFSAGTWASGKAAEMQIDVYTTPDYEIGTWTLEETLTDTGLHRIVVPDGTRGILLRIGPRFS